MRNLSNYCDAQVYCLYPSAVIAKFPPPAGILLSTTLHAESICIASYDIDMLVLIEKKKLTSGIFFNKNSDSFKPATSGKRTPPHNVFVKHPHKLILKRSKYLEIVAQRSSVKNVLKISQKSQESNCVWPYLIKLQATLLKRDFNTNTGVFLCILRNFSEYLCWLPVKISQERES